MKKLHWVLIAAVGFYLWRKSRAAQAKPKATISGMGDAEEGESYFNGLGAGRKHDYDDGNDDNGYFSGMGAVRPRAILPGRGVMAPGAGSRGMPAFRGAINRASGRG